MQSNFVHVIKTKGPVNTMDLIGPTPSIDTNFKPLVNSNVFSNSSQLLLLFKTIDGSKEGH